VRADAQVDAAKAATEARRILSLSLPEDHWQVAMAKNAQGAALIASCGIELGDLR